MIAVEELGFLEAEVNLGPFLCGVMGLRLRYRDQLIGDF